MIVIIYSKEYVEEERRRIAAHDQSMRELIENFLDETGKIVKDWAAEHYPPEKARKRKTAL